MIRKATLADIDPIMDIIRETIREMHAYGNTQWNKDYPQQADFLGDIAAGHLYVSEQDCHLLGFVCINQVEPEEYKELPWSKKGKALVIHRMAVNPIYRKKGIGTALMQFAEELAVKENVPYLKTDTYSINEKMNALFIKCGYQFVGEMRFLSREKPFYCYEKLPILPS